MHLEPLRLLEDLGVWAVVKKHHKHGVENMTSNNGGEALENLSDVD